MNFVYLTTLVLTCNMNGTHSLNLNFLDYQGAKEVREVCEVRGPGTYDDVTLDIYELDTPAPQTAFQYSLYGEHQVTRGWSWTRQVKKGAVNERASRKSNEEGVSPDPEIEPAPIDDDTGGPGNGDGGGSDGGTPDGNPGDPETPPSDGGGNPVDPTPPSNPGNGGGNPGNGGGNPGNGGGPGCDNGIGNGSDGCTPGNSDGTPGGGQDD
jgi:hypothetical protein